MLAHSPIRRLHLFELHEQQWFPPVFRSALTEWLRVLWEYTEAAGIVAPVLEKALRGTGALRIVDLCSGRAGPVLLIQKALEARGMLMPVLITDKFPDQEAMASLQRQTRGKVAACFQSVDATAVPRDMAGFRTFFNSFHHFAPDAARRILADAQLNRQPVGVFEMTERTIPKLLLCFPASFCSVFPLIFRMRPRRPVWWLFTWVLPIIPLTVAWDGFVSHLRAYTRSELQLLIRGLNDESWRWDMGRMRAPKGAIDITYLIGMPVVPGDCREAELPS